MRLILASNSPRRTEILNLAGIKHLVIPSKIKEQIDNNLTPEEVVMELSYQKANDVFKNYPNDIVIGADTIVVIDNEILGKPKEYIDAFNMLKKLSNKTHKVITGVSIISKEKKEKFYETSYVTFSEMTDQEIDNYIHSEYIYDKAGSYAIQGSCCKYIRGITGDYYNIMGLPISAVYQKIKDKIE